MVHPSVFPTYYHNHALHWIFITNCQPAYRWAPSDHFWSATTRTSGVVIYPLSPVTSAEEEQIDVPFLPPFALHTWILFTSWEKCNRTCTENATDCLCDPFCILCLILFVLFVLAPWKMISFHRNALIATVKWKIQRYFGDFDQDFKIPIKILHSLSSLRTISNWYSLVLIFYSRSVLVSSLSLKA